MTAVMEQCKSCPWRIGCVPEQDIPGYDRRLHENLTCTIAEGHASLGAHHVMACHYSKTGAEVHCAGWIANQLGPGNNIGLRLAVMLGQVPAPRVTGPQYETLAQTLGNE